MEKFIWQLYERVYDAVLLRLIPYRRLIDRSVREMRASKGNAYLDAGCGTGNLLLLLTSSGREIEATGVDFSPAMLKRAGKKLDRSGNRVRLLQHDLNSALPFSSSLFDGITCLNVLYALGKPEVLVKELHRVLKPGGRAIISTPLKEPKIFPIVGEHVETLKAENPRFWPVVFCVQVLGVFFPVLLFILINLFIKGNSDFKFYPREEIVALISSAGFELQQVDLVYGSQNWFIEAVKL
jgi:ubiquinone/menaquinone biosynthesis C-methylase UbiE